MKKKLTRISVVVLGVMLGAVLVCGNCMAEKWPTFQVWGGSLFTYGNIDASEATSRIMSNGDRFMFSSWAEYGVFSNGYVKGLASGATTNGGNLENGDVNFCKYRTPLSFANYRVGDPTDSDRYLCAKNDDSGQTGVFGYNLPRFNITASLEGLKKSGVTVSSSDETITGENGVKTVTGREVIATTGSVTIADDIVYNDDSKVYYSLEEVPKMLIYANDVNISCNVGRVDAVIIASGTLNTCSDGPCTDGNSGPCSMTKKANYSVEYDADYDAEAYSKQLVINGAIIAKTILLNRTYGAVSDYSDKAANCGTSDGSKRFCASIPAEIINYDNSILVMGKDSNTATAKTNLVTVYQRELSPRY